MTEPLVTPTRFEEMESHDKTQSVWWQWMFGQPAYIVLLFAILGAIGYGAWYGIPAAVTQVQAGYEALDVRHSKERQEADMRHGLEREQLREEAKADRAMFRESIDRNTEALKTIAERVNSQDDFQRRIEALERRKLQ